MHICVAAAAAASGVSRARETVWVHSSFWDSFRDLEILEGPYTLFFSYSREDILCSCASICAKRCEL